MLGLRGYEVFDIFFCILYSKNSLRRDSHFEWRIVISSSKYCISDKYNFVESYSGNFHEFAYSIGLVDSFSGYVDSGNSAEEYIESLKVTYDKISDFLSLFEVWIVYAFDLIWSLLPEHRYTNLGTPVLYHLSPKFLRSESKYINRIIENSYDMFFFFFREVERILLLPFPRSIEVHCCRASRADVEIGEEFFIGPEKRENLHLKELVFSSGNYGYLIFREKFLEKLDHLAIHFPLGWCESSIHIKSYHFEHKAYENELKNLHFLVISI